MKICDIVSIVNVIITFTILFLVFRSHLKFCFGDEK